MNDVTGREIVIGLLLVVIFTMLLAMVAPGMNLYAMVAIVVAGALLITPVLSGRFPRR
jgi:hypothetical protein